MEDPVQVCRRNVKTLGKTSVPVPVAHTPIVSPLARVSVLHSFLETLYTIGKTVIWAIAIRRMCWKGSCSGLPLNRDDPV